MTELRSPAGPGAAVKAPAPEPILADPHPGLGLALLHLAYDAVWLAAIVVSSPVWLVRSAVDARFRRMVRERLALDLPALGAGRRVLVHGVSVGEVKGAVPLVRELERCEPGLDVVISTTTHTGLEVARKLFPQRHVVRFPLDISSVVARFLRRLRPCAVVLVELEIWPNFLRQCNRAAVPVAVVNGRITPHSYARYRVFRTTLPQFDRISLFCVQLEDYAVRFRRLGGDPERVLVTGNMKADGLRLAAAERGAAGELAQHLGGAPGQPVLVAGSTHAPEERLVARAWREGAPHSRLILVPRHPERAPLVLRELEAQGLRGQLLTELRAGSEPPDPARPAVVDTIGELEGVYSLATLVFVGGSLVAHGGQNVLEPAAQARPVLFGPHMENFRQEAALLLEAGAALQVRDGPELARRFRDLLGDGAARERMARAGLAAVASQQGATALTLEALRGRCLAPCSPAIPQRG
jgi:3-deoxy-D-manno-octulosonic-acid transferase